MFIFVIKDVEHCFMYLYATYIFCLFLCFLLKCYLSLQFLFSVCVRWWRGGVCVHIMFTVGRACVCGGVWRPERDI